MRFEALGTHLNPDATRPPAAAQEGEFDRGEHERRGVEARLAAIVSIAADAILTIDETQCITFFNEGAERIFGYARGEVIGRPLDLLIPPRLRDIHRDHVRRFGDSPETARRMGERREILGLRRSGEEFPAEASIAKLDVDGERSYLVVLQDASERRRTERALQVSEARFRAAFEYAPVGIELTSADGRKLYVNRALSEMLGHTAEALITMSPRELVHSDDLPRMLEQRAALLEGRLPYCRVEARLLRSDGTLQWTQSTTSVIRDEAGQTVYLVGQIEDISARRRVEEEGRRLLAREESARQEAERAERRALFLARASAILDGTLAIEATLSALAELVVPSIASFVLIDFLDEDGQLRRLEARHANPARRAIAERFRQCPLNRQAPYLTRRALEEGISGLVMDVREEDIRAITNSAEHSALLQMLEPRSWITMPLSARGRRLGAIALVTDRGMEPFDRNSLSLVEEVSYRAALAIDNAWQYERAQRATALRDEVLGVVAHDLRNPLSVIAMYASLLADEPPIAPARAHKATAGIREATELMQRMISDLLDVANIELGRLAIDRKPQDPFVLLVRVAEGFLAAAEARGIALTTELPDRLPQVVVDADRLVQASSNLVENAIKFTAAGGRITLRGDADHAEVRVSVEDTGAGISSDHLPHIFDRYWQAQKSSGVRGSGLGLAITRGIVEAHGGRIHVDSEVGRGSRFTIALPRAAPSEAHDTV